MGSVVVTQERIAGPAWLVERVVDACWLEQHSVAGAHVVVVVVRSPQNTVREFLQNYVLVHTTLASLICVAKKTKKHYYVKPTLQLDQVESAAFH